MASGRVDAHTVYIKNTCLKIFDILVPGRGFIPSLPPQALGRRAVGKLERGRNPENGQILLVFSFWSLQASQEIPT